MAGHRLAATRATTHWGYFDATLPPVHEIESGDVITIDTINGAPDQLPRQGFDVLADYAEVHANVPRRLPGHIMTGPVAVRGARRGDALEIEIEAIDLRQDWGFAVIRPLEGALPDEFHSASLSHVPLDRTRKVAIMSWGAAVPLRPFFGVMGVAPPKAWGMTSSVEPRRHGGNIDNKELIAGTKLFLPIHVEGALFSCGDGHAAQGDGEVCVSAIETSLTGRFRMNLHRGMQLKWPISETPSHMMTMAFDPDLGMAARIAVRCMLELLVERKGLSREDAYMLCSFAADVRVTQMVNNQNGIHVMLEKRYFA